MIRAWLVLMLGAVTVAEPSLAVPASSTVGYVRPPSVESRMFTVAQFTPLAVVPATLQVTVWVLPPVQVTAVLGAVTRKGPAALVLLSATTGLLFTPPVTPVPVLLVV